MRMATIPSTVGFAHVGDRRSGVLELDTKRRNQGILAFDGECLRLGFLLQTYGIPRHGTPHVIFRTLALFLLLLCERCKHQIRMGIGTAGPHFGCHPDGFHQLFGGRTGPQRHIRVAFDAIGTLGDVSDGDRDDLLHLRRKCAVGENRLTEGVEGGLLVRRQIAPSAGEFRLCVGVH